MLLIALPDGLIGRNPSRHDIAKNIPRQCKSFFGVRIDFLRSKQSSLACFPGGYHSVR